MRRLHDDIGDSVVATVDRLAEAAISSTLGRKHRAGRAWYAYTGTEPTPAVRDALHDAADLLGPFYGGYDAAAGLLAGVAVMEERDPVETFRLVVRSLAEFRTLRESIDRAPFGEPAKRYLHATLRSAADY